MSPIRRWMQPNYFFEGSRQREALKLAIICIGLWVTCMSIVWQCN